MIKYISAVTYELLFKWETLFYKKKRFGMFQ